LLNVPRATAEIQQGATPPVPCPYPCRPLLSRSRLLKNSLSLRLLKKVQMQGGALKSGYPAELGPGILEVRCSEW